MTFSDSQPRSADGKFSHRLGEMPEIRLPPFGGQMSVGEVRRYQIADGFGDEQTAFFERESVSIEYERLADEEDSTPQYLAFLLVNENKTELGYAGSTFREIGGIEISQPVSAESTYDELLEQTSEYLQYGGNFEKWWEASSDFHSYEDGSEDSDTEAGQRRQARESWDYFYTPAYEQSADAFGDRLEEAVRLYRADSLISRL